MRKKILSIDLLAYGNQRVWEKRKTGKESTADLYRATLNHLKRYTGCKGLRPVDVTPVLVIDFADYLRKLELGGNTVNSYLSCFRALYNSAIGNEWRRSVEGPFHVVRLRPVETTKRAVSKEVMEQIAGADLSDSPRLEKAADLNMFSFMACGMAFADMVRLTDDNIREGMIVYKRQKTGVEIRIGITDGMQTLLDKYHSEEQPYLFPVLKEKDVKHEEYKAYLAGYNDALADLAERLGLPAKLTSYVARHTWASEALRQGIPIAVISQALGHTSEKTTRFYLALLDQSMLNKANLTVSGWMDSMVSRK